MIGSSEKMFPGPTWLMKLVIPVSTECWKVTSDSSKTTTKNRRKNNRYPNSLKSAKDVREQSIGIGNEGRGKGSRAIDTRQMACSA